MGRYYLTTTSNGHIQTLKVKYSESNEGNWDEYIFIDCPINNEMSKLIAAQWRDDVINSICSASKKYSAQMGIATPPLTPTDFKNYNVRYDEQA